MPVLTLESLASLEALHEQLHSLILQLMKVSGTNFLKLNCGRVEELLLWYVSYVVFLEGDFDAYGTLSIAQRIAVLLWS